MDPETQETRLRDLLSLNSPPIAVSFRETAPAGLKRVSDPGPAGCHYWKLAAEGFSFFTEAADHYNCTIGAHTHGVTLPAEKGKELETMIGTMVNLEYIKMEEVPEIPHRTDSFGVAVYSSLADATDPDVVLVRGNARQIMVLAEAARAAEIGHEGSMMGRPACAMIPQTIASARGNTSLGCIGNRIYTELPDDELYFAIPGARVADVVGKLETIVNANRELEKFHISRATCG